MQFSELTIRLILLILPGAIAALLVEKLTIHIDNQKGLPPFKFILYSTLLGLLTYLSVEGWYTLLNFHIQVSYATGHPEFQYIYTYPNLTFWSAIIDSNVAISQREILIACLMSIPVGLAVVKLNHYKVLHKLANKYNISKKCSDGNLYTHFLSFKEVQWVWLRERDGGLTYLGLVKYYNENGNLREIVMSDVTVYKTDEEKTVPLYEVPYIYLPFERNKFTIELPPQEESNNGS